MIFNHSQNPCKQFEKILYDHLFWSKAGYFFYSGCLYFAYYIALGNAWSEFFGIGKCSQWVEALLMDLETCVELDMWWLMITFRAEGLILLSDYGRGVSVSLQIRCLLRYRDWPPWSRWTFRTYPCNFWSFGVSLILQCACFPCGTSECSDRR